MAKRSQPRKRAYGLVFEGGGGGGPWRRAAALETSPCSFSGEVVAVDHNKEQPPSKTSGCAACSFSGEVVVADRGKEQLPSKTRARSFSGEVVVVGS
jgi:hypothetical protein